MKRSTLFSAALAVALALPAAAFGALSGSAHDFTAKGWSHGALCGSCHTPHHPDTTVPNAPLWNHKVTTATYTLYSSPTLKAAMTQPAHYGSKLCLSCHDGTVALDSFGGNTGTTFMDAGNRVGTDLRGTHPIGLVYDVSLSNADPKLYNPGTKSTPLGGTINHDLLFGTGNLECASCHDVHNTQNNASLLRITKNGSAICLTCHNK
jgi:predicted CXXCH cytochrome family protein